MQLAPRYGSDPVITLDGRAGDIGALAIRQRRRLAATLATLDDDQWAHPSRCSGWSVRDVVVHLEGTNPFWAFSMEAGVRGDPTRFLATFDPVASPAQMVAAAPATTNGELCERFAASVEAFVSTIESLDAGGWAALAEAPPGHISVNALVHHALWDSWVHERDVMLPLGLSPEESADEIVASLRYVAALGPALAMNAGNRGRGEFAVCVTEPDESFTVAIADAVHVRTGAAPAGLTLTGRAVDLLEALSIRAPFLQPVPTDVAWMVQGLAETFESTPHPLP